MGKAWQAQTAQAACLLVLQYGAAAPSAADWTMGSWQLGQLMRALKVLQQHILLLCQVQAVYSRPGSSLSTQNLQAM